MFQAKACAKVVRVPHEMVVNLGKVLVRGLCRGCARFFARFSIQHSNNELEVFILIL